MTSGTATSPEKIFKMSIFALYKLRQQQNNSRRIRSFRSFYQLGKEYEAGTFRHRQDFINWPKTRLDECGYRQIFGIVVSLFGNSNSFAHSCVVADSGKIATGVTFLFDFLGESTINDFLSEQKIFISAMPGLRQMFPDIG